MLDFRLHPEAELEAIEAVSWIRSDDPKQADLFVAALENAIERARRDPDSHRVFEGEFRRVIVGKFRHSIVYRIRKNEIQIIAVMHHSRRPGYWRDRSNSFDH